MKAALFLVPLLALSGLAQALDDDDYCPSQVDCAGLCTVYNSYEPGLVNICGKRCAATGGKPDACAEPTGDKLMCDPVSDWRCQQCQAAAQSAHDDVTTQRFLTNKCFMCHTKTGDSGCMQCMCSSLKNQRDIMDRCMVGIMHYKVPGWASLQWCAQPTANLNPLSFYSLMTTCFKCIADKAISNTWGCNNCMLQANGDYKKYKACAAALPYVDGWAAGQCLTMKGATPDDTFTRITTCLQCLRTPPQGNNWYCLQSYDQYPVCDTFHLPAGHSCAQRSTQLSGASVPVTCAPGYQPANAGVAVSATCMGPGKWNVGNPCTAAAVCQQSDAKATGCKTYTGGSRATEKLTMECLENYRSDMPVIATCQSDGKWTYSGGTCKPVCDNNKAIVAGTVGQGGYTALGLTLTLQCAGGYMEDPAGCPKVVCGPYGVWDTTNTLPCKRGCKLEEVSPCESFDAGYGMVAPGLHQFPCRFGYGGVGSANCRADGGWDAPSGCGHGCYKNNVPAPIRAEDGLVMPGPQYFLCMEGYQPEYGSQAKATCQNDGSWTVDIKCKKACKKAALRCESMDVNDDGLATSGTYTFSCKPPYYGTASTTCNDDGTWTTPTGCQLGCDKKDVTCDTVEGDSGAVAVGEYEFKCKSPYMGKAKVKCLGNGRWESPTGCQPGCVRDDLNTQLPSSATIPDCIGPLTPTGSTSYDLSCPLNYKGSPKATCVLDGGYAKWKVEGTCTPTCDNTELSTKPPNTKVKTDRTDSGQTIDLECQTGYVGKPQAKCTPTGWSEKETTGCKPACFIKDLKDVPNADLPDNTPDHCDQDAAEISHVCKRGYVGQPKTKCVSDGMGGVTWSQYGDACIRKCDNADLDDLKKNTVHLDGWTASVTTIPLTCQDGYTGAPKATCNGNGKWDVSEPCAPACKVKDIPVSQCANAKVKATTALLTGDGQYAMLECVDEYDGAPKVKCVVNNGVASWSNPEGVCTRTCDTAKIPEDNMVKQSGIVTAPSTVRVICADGYTPSKDADTQLGVQATCDDKGWTKQGRCVPKCKRSALQKPDNADNSYDPCTDISIPEAMGPDAKVTFKCASGYGSNDDPVAVCLETGMWNNQGTCKKGCKKSDLLSIEPNGNGLKGLTGSIESGSSDEVPFSCGAGYVFQPYVAGSSPKMVATCGSAGWKMPGTCVPIVVQPGCVRGDLNTQLPSFATIPDCIGLLTPTGSSSYDLSCPLNYKGSPKATCVLDGGNAKWKVEGSCTPTCDNTELSTKAPNTKVKTDRTNSGQTIDLECQTGYVGKPKAKCTPTGWSEKDTMGCTPACFIKDLKDVPNADLPTNTPDHCDQDAAEISHVCKPGYVGQPKAKCVSDGMGGLQWLQYGGSCIRKCDNADLDDLKKNTVHLDGWTASVTTIPLTCQDGYTGSPKATCNGNGKWDVSEPCAPACKVKDIPVSQCANAKVKATTALLTGDSQYAMLECVDEYDGAPKVKCVVNNGVASWSNPEGVCTRTCDTAKIPEDNMVKQSGIVTGPSTVRVTCADGYAPSKDADAQLGVQATCGDKGWTKKGRCVPKCKRSALQKPDNADNSYDPCTDISIPETMGPDAKVTFKCASGYGSIDDPVAVCLETGLWNNQGTCKKGCKKSDLLALEPNGNGLKGLTGFIESGSSDEVPFSCGAGYVIQPYVAGSSPKIVATCGSAGWKMPGQCVVPCKTVDIASSLSLMTTDASKTYAPQYLPADTIPLVCSTGYTGTVSAICGDKGKWGIQGTCSPVTCDLRTVSHDNNGKKPVCNPGDNTIVEYGKSIDLDGCVFGYDVGVKGRPFAKCTDKGWVYSGSCEQVPCKRSDLPQPVGLDQALNPLSLLNIGNLLATLSVGTPVTIKCDDSFIGVSVTATCQLGGTWKTDGTCGCGKSSGFCNGSSQQYKKYDVDGDGQLDHVCVLPSSSQSSLSVKYTSSSNGCNTITMNKRTQENSVVYDRLSTFLYPPRRRR